MVVYSGFIDISGNKFDMLVEGGRITRIGSRIEAANAERTDLSGKFVLPGFIDAHSHVIATGRELAELNLAGMTDRTAVLDAIRDHDRQLPRGDWMLANQYDSALFTDSRHITLTELDDILGDRPAVIRHYSHHSCITNSAALRAADVDESTTDPPDGEYCRDSSGAFTGELLESANYRVVSAQPPMTAEQMADHIVAAGRSMVGYGVVATTDMMTGFHDLPTELKAFQLARERGCPVRINLMLQWSSVFGARATDIRELAGALDPDWIKIEGIKLFADGAIGAATAAMTEPFASGGTGKLIYKLERLKEMVRVAHEAGYRVATHAIGDRAIDIVCDAYSATDDPSRHRIEHLSVFRPDQIERVARMGTKICVQPEFLTHFGIAYQQQLGEERTSLLKPLRSEIDAGLRPAFSSDRPITPGRPWDGIRTVVARPQPFDPSENIAVDEALLGYTEWAADLSQIESGALMPGNWADFQVYESDPRQTPQNPQQVYVGGRPVLGGTVGTPA